MIVTLGLLAVLALVLAGLAASRSDRPATIRVPRLGGGTFRVPSPHPIGYSKTGRPIFTVAGGDRAATADETRRTELLTILANPPEGTDLDAVATEAEELSTRITNANDTARRATEARARLLGVQGAGSSEVTADERQGGAGQGSGSGGGATETRLTPGQVFTESESFQQFRARQGSGSAHVVIEGRGLRAVIDNTPTSGGAFQNPTRPTDLPAQFADRAPRLVDLLDRRTTDSNTVEYVQDTTAAGGGSAGEAAEGALKPESTYTFVVVSEPVRTVAHWVNITRQSLDDNPMLQGYIEGRLSYGLDYRMDAQVLNGNGTSPNLRGILNVSGIGTYTAPASEAAVISVRKAITVAQQSEYSPDTCVLSPIGWQRIELSQDTDGMFRVTPNPAGALAPRIWGLNVVPTTAIADITFLVGAFRMGATLWERLGTTILLTDSHASNFTSNILTLLAERRAALAVWRPKAFVKGTFDAAGL